MSWRETFYHYVEWFVEYGVLAAEAADAHTIAREFPASRLLGSSPSLLVSLRDRRLSLLDGNQLGELGRDICHRIFCSVQAASRAEQRADFTESFIRRVVHDGNEQVTR